MARFKKGQEVVCIKQDQWLDHYGDTNHQISHPKFNELCIVTWCGTVEDYIPVYIQVDGYSGYFRHDFFEPVKSISELTEILESQPAEV